MKTCFNMSLSTYTEHVLLYHVMGYLPGCGRLVYTRCVLIRTECDTLHWISTLYSPKAISGILFDTSRRQRSWGIRALAEQPWIRFPFSYFTPCIVRVSSFKNVGIIWEIKIKDSIWLYKSLLSFLSIKICHPQKWCKGRCSKMIRGRENLQFSLVRTPQCGKSDWVMDSMEKVSRECLLIDIINEGRDTQGDYQAASLKQINNVLGFFFVLHH